jgi:murein DD-endopeptidase MepM/ murein hydrolase activator NlpD
MARQPEAWQIWTAAGLGAVALGMVGYGVVGLFSTPRLPAGVVPPRPSPAPFAPVPRRVVWPVLTRDDRRGQVGYVDVNGGKHGNQSRAFGAPRDGRRHAAVDLYGVNGEPVVAIANGVVIATQSFHLGTSAMLVAHPGFVALYGEIRPGSWNDFGVGIGSQVRAGQQIARIGCMVGSESDCDSHMLHFETYAPGTTKNFPWHGGAPPAALLDPTYLLLVAAGPGTNP